MSYPHKKYLRTLLNNSNNYINLEQRSLITVISEPKWLSNIGDELSLCDGILIFDTFAIPLELKQSIKKREKAIKQLQNGREYIKEQLQMKLGNYGIFAIYNPLIPTEFNPFTLEKIVF